VRLNRDADEFGVITVSRIGTVLVTQKAEMVHIRIDGGPEISLHESFLCKVRAALQVAGAQGDKS
jgi:hypothetical protein